MLNPEGLAFVAVDTHREQHTASVLNCWGHPLATLETSTDPRLFPDFLARVKESTNGHQLVFGLEDTGGLGRGLAQYLLAEGYKVKEVNPILVSRQRRRAPHPNKSDPDDAIAIGKILITEFERLPDLLPDELYVALREAVNHRRALVKEQTRLKNRLHALLRELHPSYKAMFPGTFSKSALAFWERFPTSDTLHGYGVKRLAAFLRAHSRGKVSTRRARKVLELVNKARTPTTLDKTRAAVVRSIVRQLRALSQEQEEAETLLADLLPRLGMHLETMGGIDLVNASQLLSALGPLERFSSSDQIARFLGVAPQDSSSGSRRRKRRSKRGHRQANATLYRIALYQIGLRRDGKPKNPVARAYYLKKIAEGKSKGSALTCLMRRLCDILFAMMRDRSCYRTEKFTALEEPLHVTTWKEPAFENIPSY